jgi:hypothetical protein
MDGNRKATEAWLRRHKLDDTRVTPVLATRLAVRIRARMVSHIMFAALFIVAALVQAREKLAPDANGKTALLVALAAMVGGLVLTQFLLDRWVRTVDRKVGATLTRRATHPIQPGWRALLGRSYAILGLAGFAGAGALAVSALALPDIRYPALVLLTGVAGVAAVVAVQTRHLLVRPVVAEDEASLTADVVMRIEDARDGGALSTLWSLPVVLLFGTAPGWWAAAAFAFMFAGLIGLVVVTMKTPCVGAMARQVVGIQ